MFTFTNIFDVIKLHTAKWHMNDIITEVNGLREKLKYIHDLLLEPRISLEILVVCFSLCFSKNWYSVVNQEKEITDKESMVLV